LPLRYGQVGRAARSTDPEDHLQISRSGSLVRIRPTVACLNLGFGPWTSPDCPSTSADCPSTTDECPSTPP
jgi:hypothetical protein